MPQLFLRLQNYYSSAVFAEIGLNLNGMHLGVAFNNYACAKNLLFARFLQAFFILESLQKYALKKHFEKVVRMRTLDTGQYFKKVRPKA